MKKIANFIFNPFTNDGRVLKEAISLQNNGFDVPSMHNKIIEFLKMKGN